MTETLLLPVPQTAIVTQTFAEHNAARIAHGWRYYNGGIDWAVKIGTPIKATAAGTVQRADLDKTGYGEHVRILHEDTVYLSVYGHGSKLLVKPGDKVRAGDVIMLSGNTGNSTGPHLHYELRKNNTPIDPVPLFVAVSANPVPTPEPRPAPADWNLVLPEFPKVRITCATLNIRREPATSASLAGSVVKGMAPEVLELQTTPEGVWARVGQNQWICVNFKGSEYAVPQPC